MKNNEFVRDWLKRARSNLERARVGKIKDEILYEDLCFDCQQSAEKAIKALLISINKEFPPTHSIARLLGSCRITTCMEAVEKCSDARHTES